MIKDDNFTINEATQQLVISIKNKANPFILLFSGIWIVGWIGMTATIIYGLATDPGKMDGAIFLFITCFIFAGLITITVFLWNLRGQEIITINENELKVEKVGTILTLPAKFEIAQIDKISIREKPTSPKWIKFWRLGRKN